MSENPENTQPNENQEETSAAGSKSALGRLFSRLRGRDGSGTLLRYAGIAVVFILAVVIVLLMRNFAGGVQLSRDEQLRATAQALAMPTIEAATGGVAGSMMGAYEGVSDFSEGIPRLATMDTVIPNRPRVDLTTYTVEQGDNVFSIAEQYGLKPESILWGNYDVLQDNPNFLQPGQVLAILPVDGVLVNYVAGQSLEDIADQYNTTAQAILDWPGNDLDPYDTDPDNPPIDPGAALIVPGGSRPLKDWGPPPITRDNPAVAAYYGAGACGAISEGAIGTGTFVWPTVATYLSGFDYTPPIHYGIDIAGAEGNAIFAADGGVVVYSGWSDSGYGNLLVIDHGNGWQTAYAHLSSIAVGCGASVYQGQVVAALGTTGNSSGPHLHFEMYNSAFGKVNPWNYVAPPG